MVLHNMIRDEIFRTLQGGKLHCKFLTVPTALCRQSNWGLMPKMALISRLSLLFGRQIWDVKACRPPKSRRRTNVKIVRQLRGIMLRA